jgi:phosphoribosylanthranilate isomerase
MSKTYEVSGNTTEWDDILISKGITTKENVLLAKGLNPADVKKLVAVNSFYFLLFGFPST